MREPGARARRPAPLWRPPRLVAGCWSAYHRPDVSTADEDVAMRTRDLALGARGRELGFPDVVEGPPCCESDPFRIERIGPARKADPCAAGPVARWSGGSAAPARINLNSSRRRGAHVDKISRSQDRNAMSGIPASPGFGSAWWGLPCYSGSPPAARGEPVTHQAISLWHSLAGGGLIGAGAAVLRLSTGRVAGISGICSQALTGVRSADYWRLAFLVGIVLPALVFGTGVAPRLGSTSMLALAGFLVGVGTRVGSGCTSGHGVCGIANLSPRSLVATLTFIAFGMLTVYVARAGTLP